MTSWLTCDLDCERLLLLASANERPVPGEPACSRRAVGEMVTTLGCIWETRIRAVRGGVSASVREAFAVLPVTAQPLRISSPTLKRYCG